MIKLFEMTENHGKEKRASGWDVDPDVKKVKLVVVDIKVLDLGLVIKDVMEQKVEVFLYT